MLIRSAPALVNVEGRAIIRSPKYSDVFALKQLLNTCSTETFYLARTDLDKPYTSIDELAWIAKTRHSKDIVPFVITVDKKIVGCCELHRNESQATQNNGYLSIFILRKYWSHGIGHFLLSTMLNKAEAMRIRNLYVMVNSANKRAIGLYELFGFTECSRLFDYFSYKLNFSDLVIMVNHLSPTRLFHE